MKLIDWIQRQPLMVGFGQRGGGGGTNVNVITVATEFGTRDDIAATVVEDPAVLHISTAGYSTVGDGGEGLYRRAGTEPAHDAKVQSADGAWWELVPVRGTINVRQVGLDLAAALSGWTTDWHIVDLGNARVDVANGIVKTMSGNGALIACAAGSIVAVNPVGPSLDPMLIIQTQGHDFRMQDITWDGMNQVPRLYEIRNVLNDEGHIRLNGNRHLNVKRRAAIDGVGRSDAVHVRGGFARVDLEGNLFRDISREAGTGNVGSSGTTAISVFQDTTTGTLHYPRQFHSRGNTFETVTTDDTGAARIDCDAVKYFTGENSEPEADTDFFDTAFTSIGDTFIDCIGRSFKVTASHGVISGATIIHRDALTIDGGFKDIQLQLGSGLIQGNEFIYSPVGGLSPFTHDGSSMAESRPISLFHVPKTGRAAGAPVVADNIVYNNVPSSLGVLKTLVDFTRSAVDPNFPYHVTARDNKVIGGAIETMVSLPVADDTDGPVFAQVTGNFATQINGGLCGAASSAPDGVTIVAMGNTNTGPAVSLAYDSAGQDEMRVFVRALANEGFFDTVPRISSTPGERSPSVMRLSNLYPVDNPLTSGGINLWSDQLADEETQALRPMGFFGFGLYLLSVAFTRHAQVVFAIDSNGFVDMTNNGSSVIEFGSGSNPDTDGRVNIWHDGTSLNIKNRLGSSRVFTLACLG
ncbi:MAG: hypothetical protein AAGB15_00185 [Pseudomonadota bacterium]